MMKASIIAVACAALAFFALQMKTSNKSLGIADVKAFSQWKSQLGKKYSSPAEQEYRMKVFKANLAIINSHNAKSDQQYTMSLNDFADITKVEFKARLSKDYVSSAKDSMPTLPTAGLGDIVVPDTVDWSKSPVISNVYDVRECNAGYAFAAIQVVEAAKYLDKSNTELLSAQNLVDCSCEVPYTNSGCNGGCVYMSLRYVKDKGLATDSKYPYIAGDSGSSAQCQSQIDRPYTIANAYGIPAGRSDILKNLVASKPVVITVDPKVISVCQFYSGGIYDGADCSSTTETYYLMLVGYGIDTTVKEKDKSRYWILKNHLGKKWGANGFVKIARSEGPVPGICGITDNGLYVQV